MKFDCRGLWENPYDIVANVLDNNIIVSGFKSQSHYYIHFRTNNFGNGINSLNSQLLIK